VIKKLIAEINAVKKINRLAAVAMGSHVDRKSDNILETVQGRDVTTDH